MVNAVLISESLIPWSTTLPRLRFQVVNFLASGEEAPEQSIHTVGSVLATAKARLSRYDYDPTFLSHLGAQHGHQ